MNRTGVGTSTNRDSAEAAREAATSALAQLRGATCKLTLVFATAGHDAALLVASVREASGGAPLAGCSAEGVISRVGSNEGSHAVVVAAFAGELKFHTLLQPGLSSDSLACGRALGRAVSAIPGDGETLVLLFPDGLKGNHGALLAGLQEAAPQALCVGGSAGDMLRFERTWQFCDDEVASDAVSAVVIRGAFRAATAVSHGCEPIGIGFQVTDSDGHWVRSLDGRPAWEVFQEYLPDAPEDLNPADFVHLCLAKKLVDADDDAETDLVIRTPLGLDKDNGALLFPGGIEAGDHVELTRRDIDSITASARQAAAELRATSAGRQPFCVLQFDCAGRGQMVFGAAAATSVVEPLIREFGPDVPWIGFHTYAEIAPLRGVIQYHNYTVALCALYDVADDAPEGHEPR